MPLQKQIEADFLAAFKAGEKEIVETLRMLKSALINRKIEKSLAKEADLPDEEVVAMAQTEIKKRKDSIEAYSAGGRPDLAEKEAAEMKIIEKYLPAQLSEEEVSAAIQAIIAETGATAKDFGKVMGLAMAKMKGQTDGQVVSALVKKLLN